MTLNEAITQINVLFTGADLVTKLKMKTAFAILATAVQDSITTGGGSGNATLSVTPLTKAQLRAYTGALREVVQISDVVGLNLAVFNSDSVAVDNADTEADPVRIIVDGSGRRYQLMDQVGFDSLILRTFSPDIF